MFVAAGGVPEKFNLLRKVHRRQSDAKGPVLVNRIWDIVVANPGRSMRLITTKMGVLDRTMRRLMQEDISYKSYALGHGPFLSEATKIRQAEKAEKLLAKIKEPTIPQTCFFFR